MTNFLRVLLVFGCYFSAEAALADTYLFYMPGTRPGEIGIDMDGDNLLHSSEMDTNLNLVVTNTDSRQF